ncbi:LOW QUALITY PROTEIN: conserved hypothetical protein, partial [Streptomyces sp. e14]
DAFGLGRTALPDGTAASVAIVCDGVSSATRPDEASLAASRTASEFLLAALPRGTHPQQAMHEAIVAAAQAVDALAGEPAGAREHSPHQNAPACTLVGAVVTGELLVVGWVGDSPRLLGARGPRRPGRPAHRGRLVGRADGRGGPDERGGGVRRRARPRDHRLARRGRLRTGAAHRLVQAGPARRGGGLHGRAVELRRVGGGDGPGAAPGRRDASAAQCQGAGRPRPGRRGPRQRNSGARAVPAPLAGGRIGL